MNRKTKQFVATLVLLGLIVLHSFLIPRTRLVNDVIAITPTANDSSTLVQASARTRAPIDLRSRPSR